MPVNVFLAGGIFVKQLAAIATFALLSGPANAVVYNINQTFGGSSYDYSTNNWDSPTVPISVAGWFETSVTSGVVSGSNITAWEMVLTNSVTSATLSSAGLFGTPSILGSANVVGGNMTVPSGGGSFKFEESFSGFLNGGTELLTSLSYVSFSHNSSSHIGDVVFYDLVDNCDTAWDSSTCSHRKSGSGHYASGVFDAGPIGTVGTVPVPAGLPLLLAGLAALGLMRRKRKAA